MDFALKKWIIISVSIILAVAIGLGAFWFFTKDKALSSQVDINRIAVMGEEIFGPIMPIIAFDDFDLLVEGLKTKDKPLALYLFSSDKKHKDRVTTELSYGGGCINDVVIHLASSELGFGGVGESGMGAYHGKVGFDTFSHLKSVVDKKNFIDLPMRYQPYNKPLYEKLLRMFLK